MGAAVEQAGGDVKIGGASHTARNVGVLVGGLVAAFGIYWVTANNNKNNAAAMARFDAFRALYAQKCSVPAYAAKQSDGVNEGFLSSTAQQAEVDKQMNALSGGATCDAVAKALKAVDLSVPSAP